MRSLHVLAFLLPLTVLAAPSRYYERSMESREADGDNTEDFGLGDAVDRAVVPVGSQPVGPAVVVGSDVAPAGKAVAVPAVIPSGAATVVGAVAPAVGVPVLPSGIASVIGAVAPAVGLPVSPSGVSSVVGAVAPVVAPVVPATPDDVPTTVKAVAVPVSTGSTSVVAAVVPAESDDVLTTDDAVDIVGASVLDPNKIIDTVIDSAPTILPLPKACDLKKCMKIPVRMANCASVALLTGAAPGTYLKNCGLTTDEICSCATCVPLPSFFDLSTICPKATE